MNRHKIQLRFTVTQCLDSKNILGYDGNYTIGMDITPASASVWLPASSSTILALWRLGSMPL